MTTAEYLALDKEKDKARICQYNRELVEKYPFLLPRDKEGSLPLCYDWSWTIMDLMPPGWAIAFGDEILEDLREALDRSGLLLQYRVLEIKDKFGELRWYDNGATDEVSGILTDYSRRSGRICVKCGKLAVLALNELCTPFCDACAMKSGHKYPEAFETLPEKDS